MRRFLIGLFCALSVGATGCASNDPQSSSVLEPDAVLELSYWAGAEHSLVASEYRPPATLPAGLVEVECKVVSVDLPWVDSPSLMGEQAVATFRLAPGAQIPMHSGVHFVRLRYDNYAKPFRMGQTRILRFLSDGRFYGVAGVLF